MLELLKKRWWRTTGHMLQAAHDFINQLPAFNPMQQPSSEVFWLDIMTRPRP